MSNDTTQQDQPDPPSCYRRILVVENDLMARSDHIHNLKRWSYEPVVAEGQGEALLVDAERKAHQYRCQVALVDMRLLDDYNRADTSGLDLVPRLKPTVSIIVSGYGDRENVVRALRDQQAIDFVGKEDGPGHLHTAIQEAIKKTCKCSLKVQWQPPDEPVDILRRLRLYDSGVPRDQPRCVLGQLYAQEAISRLILKPVTTYYHSPEKFTSHERSVVMVAQSESDAGEWHRAEIIKLTLRERIENEIQNYRSYVAPYLAPQRTARIEDKQNAVVFWDIGAVRYTNIAADNRIPLRQWYTHAKVDDIKSALGDLFRETLGPWYRRAAAQRDDTVYGYYTRLFSKMEKRMEYVLQHYEQNEAIRIPGVPCTLHNPTLWTRRRGPSSLFISQWEVYTHGDLHSDNIFVDQHNQTSIIDYERSGPGYILRDFVELEADIRLRQLSLSSDQLVLAFHFDLLLLAPDNPDLLPAWKDIPGADEQIQVELRKAFEVICEIRQLMFAMTRCGMDEYYWALLMETLISVVRNYTSWEDQQAAQLVRNRALLSAALLCERLEHWHKPWPPEEWLSTTSPIPKVPRFADVYTAYETGIEQLLNQLSQEHERYADALLYQTRLLENVTYACRYGDTETRRSERLVIIDQLNSLALSTLGVSFQELCR
jgi:DNA-binding NarL/FixJ family response regulator